MKQRVQGKQPVCLPPSWQGHDCGCEASQANAFKVLFECKTLFCLSALHLLLAGCSVGQRGGLMFHAIQFPSRGGSQALVRPRPSEAPRAPRERLEPFIARALCACCLALSFPPITRMSCISLCQNKALLSYEA